MRMRPVEWARWALETVRRVLFLPAWWLQQWVARLFRGYAHVDWRRAGVIAVYTAALTVLWLTLYSASASIPHRWRPAVDTVTLPRIETLLFGRYFGTAMPYSDALYLAASFVYAAHFAVPFVFLGVAVVAHAGGPHAGARPLSFVGALVASSFLMHATQVLVPTAPPWYTERAGHAPASYQLPGDPGGLARVDVFLNTTFFHAMYGAAPIVFGSWPSGHVAWPLTVLFFQWTWTGRVLSALHVVWVSWAALYLHHHFLVDVLSAYFFVVAGIWLARVLWLLLGRFLGGADGLLGLLATPPPSAELRRAWERAADARFLKAVYAVVLMRGWTPLSAPDVVYASMAPDVRVLWAPDIGDVPPPQHSSPTQLPEFRHAHAHAAAGSAENTTAAPTLGMAAV